MPRRPRLDVPGCLHHIVVRGIDPAQGINPFRAPFRATYKVVEATGKLAKYQGLIFPARGTLVVSTKRLLGDFSGAPVGIVYVEVSRIPIRE